MAAGKFSVEAIFKARDQMSAVIGKMASKFAVMSKGFGKSIGEMTKVADGWLGGMKTVGLVTAGAAVAGGAAINSLAQAGLDFDQQMSAVAAVSLMTRDEVMDLEKEAKRLGATTTFTATEVAQGMELMGRAGFTNAQVMTSMGGVLGAAAAEGATLADTASNISNVLKGMGLAVVDPVTGLNNAVKVADVLTLASAKTNSSISSLGESMANVSSTARQFKIPLEDTVAAVAMLQDVGLDASEAGSALNTMLTKMAAPTKEVKAQMKKMGVTFQTTEGNMLPLADVMENLAKASEKSGGNMEQVAFFADLVGLRGQKAAANLKDLFKSGEFKKLADSLKGASGSAEKMAKIRMDNVRGDWEQLTGAIDTFKIELFDTQKGPLRAIVQDMTKWVEANKDVIKTKVVDSIKWLWEHKDEILTWVSRAGRLAAAFTAVALAVKTVQAAVLVLNFITALNPIAAILLAILTAGALIVAFWPEITKHFRDVWEGVKAAFHEGFIMGVWEVLKQLFLHFSPVAWIANGINALVKYLFGIDLFAAGSKIFMSIHDGLAAGGEKAIAAVKRIIQRIRDMLPFSPAKDGPFKDLDKIKLVETIAATIKPAPMVDAMTDAAKQTAAALAGVVPMAVDAAQTQPQVVGPEVRAADRMTTTLAEDQTLGTGELTIRDETKRAEVTKKPKGNLGIILQPSGAF